MKRKKFTRTPRADDLIPQLREAGLGLNVLPTYLVFCDHANNKTGRAWPKIGRISDITGLCRRTIERHISALCEAGLLLKNHQRRSKRGRFSTCGYCVVAVLFFAQATVRHRDKSGKRDTIKNRTKPSRTTPLPPKKETKEAREERKAVGAARRLAQMREIGADV